MNVYDFDMTIYDGDSTIDFYLFSLRRHPRILFCIPQQIKGGIKYKLNKIDKTSFKEEFYCFLKKIPDIDSDIIKFWDMNEHKIKNWYKKRAKAGDVVISASPDFLLNEICKRLCIQNLLASKVDRFTGKYQGVNCYGNEKVKRFKEKYGDKTIDEFYSDSKSDIYLARLADSAYIIKKNKVQRWSVNYK